MRTVAFRIGLIATVLLPAACAPRGDDAAALRQALDTIAAAFENRDLEPLDDFLAADFAADELDRRGALLLARRYLAMHRDLGVTLAGVTVEVLEDFDPPRATVRFKALLTGGERALPERAGWYDFETGWRRDGGDWRMIRAAWERQW